MRVMICDDNEHQRAALSMMVKSWEEETGNEVSISEAESAEYLLFHADPIADFDLLLLDIQMGDMSGIELARIVRKSDMEIPIAFVTGVKDHMRESFDIGVLDYILKPLKKEDCFKCLDKAYQRSEVMRANTVLITSGHKSHRFKANEILYFEAARTECVAHTTSGEFRFTKQFSALEKELPDNQFVRIQRSFIVNVHYIRTFELNCVILDDDTELKLSKNHLIKANTVFIEYHRSRKGRR